ncbi:hypothetical protein GGI02_000939 [Coemansia sp. RSA 2322]|nr:hypothetical protein GGI02_000939 [Coemansia sp. RSA 2322]
MRTSTIRFNLYGDPQIEGDAKLSREPATGKYDLLVNDYYQHHVYKATIAAFCPHYVVTMGDIFSSQWVSKDEYNRRLQRFRWISHQIDSSNRPTRSNHIYYYMAGNHDIGYGEETEAYHINRFASNFGPLNTEWLTRVDGKLHRFAILNAMNLDKTRHAEYRAQAWSFVKHLAAERQQNPEIPLILFSHIPLHKQADACTAAAGTRYLDGFVEYQDYLSPTTSAYLLHCLAPVFVLSGHDHDGCRAAHTVKADAGYGIALGNSGKLLRLSKDLCGMSPEDLDNYQASIEAFAHQTVAPATGFNGTAGTSTWDTLEVTVRSVMGAYGGAAGVFDIEKSRRGLSPPGRHARAQGTAVTATAGGYEYRYREIQLGNHLVVRVLLVADAVGLLVVPALLLLLS